MSAFRDLRVLALLCLLVPSSLAYAQNGPEQSNQTSDEENKKAPEAEATVLATPPQVLTGTAMSVNSLMYMRYGRLTRYVKLSENLTMRLMLGTTFFAYNNADFRQRGNETLEDQLRYSDDKSYFVETQLAAGISYAIHRDVRIDLGFRHRGLWGVRADQAAGKDALSQQYFGYLGAFDQLAITYTPQLPKGFDFTASLGRQNFMIGGTPREYVLGDTLDGLTMKFGFGRFGQVRGLFDLFTASTLSDESLRELQVDTSAPDRFFRGQVNTIRVGGVYDNDGALVPGLTLKAYYIYAKIGASDVHGTGADVSYNGALGNFADNDYTYVWGGRAGYEVKLVDHTYDHIALEPNVEFAQSGGIDRKEAVARDVKTEGNAYGANLSLHGDHGETRWDVLGSFYHFDGAKFASDGLEFKSGFVSMNALPVGGIAMARIQGIRPSASVDASGIRYSPNDKLRYAGTEFINLGGAVKYKGTRVWLWYWTYRDTSQSFLNFSKLDAIDPPFGYSRTEFAAERRLGKQLAQEYDFGIEQFLNDKLRLHFEAGVVLPEQFYRIGIAPVAGDQLGGNQHFWVVSAGATAWL
jgi:hypothetical protein